MDKLKTRVLLISLIILALVSVSAVAAADSDEVINDNQDDIDLSEETISDVEDSSVNADKILSSSSEDTLKEEGKCKVTLYFHMMSMNGEVVDTESNTLSPGVGWSFTIKKIR